MTLVKRVWPRGLFLFLLSSNPVYELRIASPTWQPVIVGRAIGTYHTIG